MKIAKEVEELLNDAVLNAGRRGNEYVTPEHVGLCLQTGQPSRLRLKAAEAT